MFTLHCRSLRQRVAACALLSIAASLPAVEAEPAKERSLGKAKASGPLMTRAELRDCLAQQERNRAQASELVVEQEKLNAEKVSLLKRADELKEQLPSVDRTSAEAVAKYNEQVTTRDAAVDTLITRTNEFNGRVEAAQKTRSIYVSTCENRRFDERDEIAIRSGK